METQLELGTRAWNRKRRRTRILEQASRLFDRQGIDRTSMEQIARAAGCTRRTLYAYFESWDDLALHVLLNEIVDRWEFQQAAMKDGNTGLEKMRLWAEAYFEYSRRHPHRLKNQLFWDSHGVHRESVSALGLSRHQDTIEPIVQELRQIFMAGQADGSIRENLDVDSTLLQYAYSVRAVLHRAMSPAESFAQFESTEFARDFIELFMRGIAARRES